LKQVQDMVDLPFLHEVSMLKHIFYMSWVILLLNLSFLYCRLPFCTI
jgi:hypothetical protein